MMPEVLGDGISRLGDVDNMMAFASCKYERCRSAGITYCILGRGIQMGGLPVLSLDDDHTRDSGKVLIYLCFFAVPSESAASSFWLSRCLAFCSL